VTAVRTEMSVAERTAGGFPSLWGGGDEAGALNEITPETVRRAVGLVRQGGGLDLAHVPPPHVPALPGRALPQYPPTH